MKRSTAIMLLLVGRLMVAPSMGDSIRVSFLEDARARESTLELLQQAGCPEDDVNVLRRAIAHYYQTPFNYNLSAFPTPKDAFYEFALVDDFVSALSTNRLSEIEHMFELNCLDTALLIAGHDMDITADFTEMGSPYLAICTFTNRALWLVPVSSLQDAYNTIYPEWYQRFRDNLSGREPSLKYKTMAACLFQYHALPIGTSESDMGLVLSRSLRQHWTRCGIQFPTSMLIAMLHRARTDHHVALSDHFGVIIKTDKGYIYLEKAGGQGPFLRIDTKQIENIAIYYSTMISPDYPYNYMTIGHDVMLEVKQIPALD